MEKRFFLSIVLSFIVLYVWTAVSPKPRQGSSTDISQHIATEEDARSYAAEQRPLPSLPPPTVDFEEQITRLESADLIAELSNRGGTLMNVVIKDYDDALPLTKIAGFEDYAEALFSLQDHTSNMVVYYFEDESFKISKIYSMGDHRHNLDLEVIIQNKTDMSKQMAFNVNLFSIDSSRLDKNDLNKDGSFARDKSLLEYVVNSGENIYRKNNAYKFSDTENRVFNERLKWAGFRSRYFCAIVKPYYETTNQKIVALNDKELEIKGVIPLISIPAGGTASFKHLIFVGPEKSALLKSFNLELEDIKRYYRWGLFDAVAKFLYKTMSFVHKIIPNWGFSIILISLLIYFAMYPLTMKSMASMKDMQALQPKIVALREKYKNNPQKLNQETMELYKKHKVNPLGGCFPMFLQMPIFLGIYQVLFRSIDFKGAGFLWIKDLAAPDRLFIFPFGLPIIGNELNLLPILMIIVMFFQQKISAKNMVVTDPAQRAQQKMMQTIMPIFLGFIFYKFASGLTLYFTMFYLLSTFTQWKISKNTGAV